MLDSVYQQPKFGGIDEKWLLWKLKTVLEDNKNMYWKIKNWTKLYVGLANGMGRDMYLLSIVGYHITATNPAVVEYLDIALNIVQ